MPYLKCKKLKECEVQEGGWLARVTRENVQTLLLTHTSRKTLNVKGGGADSGRPRLSYPRFLDGSSLAF